MSQLDRPWVSLAVRSVGLGVLGVYVWLIIAHAGPPEWSAPWSGVGHVGGLWLAVAAAAATLSWADGLLYPWITRRRTQRLAEGADENERARWRFTQLIIRASVYQGGGIWGLVLSFQARDSRYAIVSMFISALLTILLPWPRPRAAARPRV